MFKFTVKRILLMIPSVIVITLLTFLIMANSSGSPGAIALGIKAKPEDIAAYNHEIGYDRPVMVRYGEYLWNLCHGDLGTSYKNSKVSVTTTVMSKFPITLNLLSLILASLPGFWFALLLMLLFSLKLGWLPSFGLGSWKHYVMPLITLALPSSAYIARMVRITMIQELSSDYVRTARAKGASPVRIIFVHVLRNALMPVITTLGMSFAGLLGGAVVCEQVFGLPGVGQAILNAINSKDAPIVMGATVILSLLYMVIMLVMDLLNALLNPKIRDNMG